MPHVLRDGVSLYYETQGDAGEPLLLLMGLAVDAHGWEFQVPDFARRHRVILVDNRGMGRSDKPAGPYTTRLLAEDAVAVLDAVGVDKAHVVGLSMGGMIAQELALGWPERVGALVLAATYAHPDEAVRQTATDGAKQSGGLSLLAGGGTPADFDVMRVMRVLTSLVFSPGFLATRRDWLLEFFGRSMGYGFSVEGFAGQVAAVLQHDTRDRPWRVSSPTLILTGTDDRLVPPACSDELAFLIRGARLVRIPGGTHGFNFELPERFNREVLDYLAEFPLART